MFSRLSKKFREVTFPEIRAANFADRRSLIVYFLSAQADKKKNPSELGCESEKCDVKMVKKCPKY
jgi:hypothetical protein